MTMTELKEQRGNNAGGITGKGWLPGQSGNPAGRPKDSVTTLLKEKDRHKIAQKLYEMALSGDLGAIREYLDRTEGKVSQDVKLEGLVGVLTPQYLEEHKELLDWAVKRRIEAGEATKQLIKGHREPINEGKQPSISESKD